MVLLSSLDGQFGLVSIDLGLPSLLNMVTCLCLRRVSGQSTHYILVVCLLSQIGHLVIEVGATGECVEGERGVVGDQVGVLVFGELLQTVHEVAVCLEEVDELVVQLSLCSLLETTHDDG